jgi:hypothetical protein
MYFGNYSKDDARLALGEAEGRTVIGVYRPSTSTHPEYVITIDWRGDRAGLIRDYRYVPYLMTELAFEPGS